jgi:hypothetical protein
LLTISHICPENPVTEKISINPYASRRHVIGLQASSIAGIGLTYKYALFDLLHWRLTGMILPSNKDNASGTYSNVGTDLHFNLFQTTMSQNIFLRNYIAGAISYWEYNYSDGYVSARVYAGGTLGLELVIASRYTLHGDFGFGYYQNNNNHKSDTNFAGGFGFGILF